MTKKFANILQTIGNTPLVKLNRMAPAGVNLYVKIEAFNPGGSVKDRLALGIIEDAEKNGVLKPGQTVIEATTAGFYADSSITKPMPIFIPKLPHRKSYPPSKTKRSTIG